MPQVPTYDAPQVSSQALPGFRQSSVASPQLFAAGAEEQKAMGRSMMQAGDQLGAAAAKMQIEDNETEAKAFDTEFANYGRDVLRGAEGDPSTGYLSRQGKAALDDYGKAKDALFKKREELIGKASNDRVRAILTQTFDSRMLGFRDTMDSHASAQRNAHMKVTSELRLDAFAEDMADNWANPAEFAKHFKGLQNEAAQLADTQGITEAKEREAFIRQYTTQGHERVLGRLLSTGNSDAAEQYMKEHGKDIEGKTRDQYTAKLEAVGGLKKAQEAVDALMAMDMPTSDAMKYIEEKYSGADEKNIKAEFLSRRQVNESAKREDEEKLLSPINKALGDARLSGRVVPLGSLKTQLASLATTSPDLYARAANLIADHNDHVRAKAQAAAGGGGDAGDRTLNATLLEWDMKSNPDKYKGVDMMPILVKMAQNKQLAPNAVDRLMEAHKGISKPSFESRSLVTANDRLETLLQGSYVEGRAFSALSKTRQTEIKARALQVLDPLLQQYQKAKGDKASDDEVAKIVSSIFVNKTYRDTFMGITVGDSYGRTVLDETGAPQRVGDLVVQNRVEGINPARRQRIEQALRANNQPVTPQTILETYNEWVLRTNKKGN